MEMLINQKTPQSYDTLGTGKGHPTKPMCFIQLWMADSTFIVNPLSFLGPPTEMVNKRAN